MTRAGVFYPEKRSMSDIGDLSPIVGRSHRSTRFRTFVSPRDNTRENCHRHVYPHAVNMPPAVGARELEEDAKSKDRPV
jgi:hypothetical protein